MTKSWDTRRRPPPCWSIQRCERSIEALHAEIDAAKDAFLKALKEQSGSKKDLEKETVIHLHSLSEDQFYVALNRIKDEVD